MELKIERYIYFDLVIFLVWIERKKKHQRLQILVHSCMPTAIWLFGVRVHACASHLDCHAYAFGLSLSSHLYLASTLQVGCWLNLPRSRHDAVVDAYHSMSLFNSYRTVQHDAVSLYQLQLKTLHTPIQPSFAKVNPEFEGCCMGNRKVCTCGAPFYG